jgi:hypothetical protein
MKKNLRAATIRGNSPRQSANRTSQPGSKNEEFQTANGNILQNGAGAEENGEASVSRKPEISVTAKGAKDTKDEFAEDGKKPTEKYIHFQNKRLCERWLDNSFMVLYEVIWLPKQGSYIRPTNWSETGSSCIYNMALRICSVQATINPIQEKREQMGNSRRIGSKTSPSRRSSRGLQYNIEDSISCVFFFKKRK